MTHSRSQASLWHTSGCNDALRAASRNCVTTAAGRETTLAVRRKTISVMTCDDTFGNAAAFCVGHVSQAYFRSVHRKSFAYMDFGASGFLLRDSPAQNVVIQT